MNFEDPFKKSVSASEQKSTSRENAHERLPQSAALSDLNARLVDAEAALSRYDELTREVRYSGISDDPHYDQKRRDAEKELALFASEIAERFGVRVSDIRLWDWEREPELLARVVVIAREAQDQQFDLHLDDDALIEETQRLIDDFEIYTEPVRKTGYHPDKNYGLRSDAKSLLIGSLARELAKRFDLGDGVLAESLVALNNKIGVNFFSVLPRVVRVEPSLPHSERSSSGLLPQIGATGTWKTPDGYVSGKIISGSVGGPYVIQTPYGNIKVSRIG